MDAIRKIEAALAALHPEADSPWTNLDKMPYIHKTDDKNASPWSCAVVGRFDYLPTMDYMLACQPSAIREVLQTLASKEAELAAREAEIARLREAAKLAWRALCDAEGVLATVDPEDSSESEKLEEIIERVSACAGVLFCELRLPVLAITTPQPPKD